MAQPTARTISASRPAAPVAGPSSPIPDPATNPTPPRPAPASLPEAIRFAHESEVAFARILTSYAVAWEYEPRTFPLAERDGRVTQAFTPDFYLPEYDRYIELTTLRQPLVTDKHRKLRSFRQRYPEIDVTLLHRRDCERLFKKYGATCDHPPAAIEFEEILPARRLRERTRRLAQHISRDYAGKTPVLVGVLDGAVCFLADLARSLAIPVRLETLALAPPGPGGRSIEVVKDVRGPVTGCDVLVVDDLVDTGLTLHRVLDHLAAQQPASLAVCALLDRTARRLAAVRLDYVGFAIPDVPVAGYGGDHAGSLRGLASIGEVT